MEAHRTQVYSPLRTQTKRSITCKWKGNIHVETAPYLVSWMEIPVDVEIRPLLLDALQEEVTY